MKNTVLSNKFVLLFAVLAMVLVMAACSSTNNKTNQTSSPPVNTDAPPAPTEAPKEALKFPEKDITVVIPFAAGGGTDQVGRLLVNIAKENTGKNIVVKNVTGGTGSIGFREVANAKPDGYTIAVSTSNIVLNRIVGISDQDHNVFDSIITVNFDSPALFVNKDSKWNTAEEFIEYAKTNKATIGSSSPGGIMHIGTLQLEQTMGVKFNILAGASGGNSAAAQLMGGHVDALIVAANEAIPVRTGDFKMLATMTDERLKAFPDVPTFKELGYDNAQIAVYRGFVAPKGTPKEVVDYLHQMFKEAMEDERFISFMDEQLSNIVYMGPEDSDALWVQEDKKLTDLVTELDIKTN